jgi:hypothetical protein
VITTAFFSEQPFNANTKPDTGISEEEASVRGYGGALEEASQKPKALLSVTSN